VKETEVVESAA